MKHVANIITGFRIPCSLLMLFFPAFSWQFYLTYCLCGISDMVDGTIARKTNSAGGFGAKLDTTADIVFAVAALVKLLPALCVPQWLLVWMGIIAMIKTGSVIAGFVFRQTFVALHTPMNKITGALLFLLPLTLPVVGLKYSAAAVCVFATLSAIQEGYCVVNGDIGR